jgi:hypothetical protein
MKMVKTLAILFIILTLIGEILLKLKYLNDIVLVVVETIVFISAIVYNLKSNNKNRK